MISDAKNSTGREHKTLCCAIQDLSKAEEDSHPSIFLSHLTPKQQAKIINLVGQRCTVNCQLNGKAAKVLWDTGPKCPWSQKISYEEHFQMHK